MATPAAEPVRFESELPFAERSRTLARSLLRHHLESAGAGRILAENAVLVLHELVSNCIDHGWPCPNETLHLAWEVTPERVDLTVIDHGPHPRCPRCHPARFAEAPAVAGAASGPAGADVVPREPEMESPRGRGLLIVEGLSDRWEVTTEAAATRVTATILAP